jgi:hypothetical protein
MSSHKNKRDSNNDGKNKKSKITNVPDFVSDGLETKDIRDTVQDIMLYMQNNKDTTEYAELINKIRQDERFKSFEERYPMLFDMVTKKEGFNYESLEFFLSMRDKIITNQISTEDASKHVGQVWFDKYYKK